MTQSLPHVVLYDAAAGAWRQFAKPLEIVQTDRCDEVMSGLRRVEALVESRGLYAAGFVSYEAAPAFDRALVVRESAGFPLLWFGLFDKMEAVPRPAITAGQRIECAPWEPSITAVEYAAVIAQLRESSSPPARPIR